MCVARVRGCAARLDEARDLGVRRPARPLACVRAYAASFSASPELGRERSPETVSTSREHWLALAGPYLEAATPTE